MTFSNVRRRLRIPPKRVAVSERFHSALLAFFFNIPAINMILTAVLGVSLMSFLYAFTVGCILLSFAACGGILRLRTGGLYPAALAAFLLILYLTGILCGMVSGVDVGRFLLLSLLPLLLPIMLSFDRADFLRFSMVFTAPGIFFLPRIFAVEPVNRTITMGVSYAFLLPVLCALLYLFFLRKEDPPRRRAFMLILAAIQAVYAAQIFLYGTRGAVFSIALCAALAVCVRVRRRGGISLYPRRTVLLTVLLLLLFLFFWDLLGALHGLLASRSLSVRFIDKLLALHRDGDILNGRKACYRAAWEGIFAGTFPMLFGHGISTFAANTGMVYPHNFLLQLLYDGGLLLFCLVAIPLAWRAVGTFRRCDRNTWMLFLLLFCSAVIRALFSADLWKQELLWFFFGILLAGEPVVLRRKPPTGNLLSRI